MSEQNVEIAKRGITAFNRRDVETLDEITTDDYEWFPAFAGIVEGGSYRGRAGIETYFRAATDTWEEVRVVADEFRDLGQRVLMLGRVEGRGRGSGVEVDAPHAVVWDFRNGKISRTRGYFDPRDALRAAGLSG
jgi:ketosteroid isomerase-like protein